MARERTNHRSRRHGIAAAAATVLALAAAPLAHAAPGDAALADPPAASSGARVGAARGWATRNVTSTRTPGTTVADSVSVTADGTVDLLRVEQESVGDVSVRWTATLLRQPPTGKLARVRTFSSEASSEIPTLRSGEDGSSILLVPSGSTTRAEVWTRRNGSKTWRRTPAPSAATGSLAVDTQKNGRITIAYTSDADEDITLHTATAVPGGRWTAHQETPLPAFEDAGLTWTSVALDVTADGAATVALISTLVPWDFVSAPAGRVHVASRAAGATRFRPATRLTSQHVRQLSVAQAGARSVVAYETVRPSGRTDIYVRTRTSAKAAWKPAQKVQSSTGRLTDATSYGTGVDVVGSPTGRVTLVHSDTTGRTSVRVLGRTGSMKFGKPVATISKVRSFLLAQERNGTATLVTTTGAVTARTGKVAVRTSSTAGTRWSKPRTLGTAITGFDGASSLAVAPSGATATWWVAQRSGKPAHLVASHR